MGCLQSYSAIATKIRAMESRLLKREDFEKLAGMESIPQAAEYLSRLPAYRSVLETIALADREMSSVNRDDMEQLLIGTLYYDFAKLYRFGNKSQKEVLKLFFRKYEVAEIKHALRHVFNAKRVQKESNQPHPGYEDKSWNPTVFREHMQRFTEIHLEEMAEAQNVHDLLLALRDTDYGNVLEKTGALEKESLFDCEMVLDLNFFTEFWKQKNKFLNKKECGLLTETFGTRLDMLNMTWIYRAKKYYQVSDASIYGLLIPVRYRLKESDIREMAAAQDMESLNKAIQSTYYGRRFKMLESAELETLYHEFLQKLYVGEKRREPYSIAVITGYLYEKEEEIRKLTMVLEGVWYALPKEETLAYVYDTGRKDGRYDR